MKRLSVAKYIQVLKEEFPLSLPVTVTVGTTLFDKERGKRECANIQKGSTRFWIRINKHMTATEKKDALCHEWAHGLSPWRLRTGAKADHGDEWGKNYARVYRYMTYGIHGE